MSNTPNFPMVTFNQAYNLLSHALPRGAAVMLHGSPSSGKTAIGNKVAKDFKLMPIVFSLMDHVPEDISGLPDLSGEKATFKPFDTFPVKGDKVPAGYNGWLIILDEYTSGSPSMKAAANKIIYERMVGNHKLHPKAFVVGMGNLSTDNAFVLETPSHAVSRQIHLYVEQDITEWTDWAIQDGLDSRVVTYAMSKPTLITQFDPEFVGINYPCARTMETLSNQVKGESLDDRELLPIIQGTVGQGPGLEFYNFCKLADQLPTINQIKDDPYGCTIPQKMGHRWALTGMLVEHFKPDAVATLMPYILRLTKDAQYILIKLATRKDPSIVTEPEVATWLRTNAAYFAK